MKRYEVSARVTQFATCAVAVLMLVLLACFPVLVGHYHEHFRPLLDTERIAITGAFYVCGVPVLMALWHMNRLLRNILRAELFTQKNVGHIRVVRWCCLAVSVVCLFAAFGFPSLIFLSTIMAFLSLVVTVVGQVMKAAVEIREENDLTV